MGFYFEDCQSMAAWAGGQVERSLEAIVRRYVGQNPPHALTFRAFSKRGILRGKDYRYHADFNQFFPEAKTEQFVYAWAKMWADVAGPLMFDVNCLGPTAIFCNGEAGWKSNIFSERYPDQKHRVTIGLRSGWNHFVIRAKKTRAGFGWGFGSWLGKHPYCLMMPSPEREGQEGWLFTQPMSGELAALPGAAQNEPQTGLSWLPVAGWDKEHLKMGQLKRLFGTVSDARAVGWTRAVFSQPGEAKYSVQCRHHGPVTVFIAGREVCCARNSGKISATVTAPFGTHDVTVECVCKGSDWGFELTIADGKQDLMLVSPCNLSGSAEQWIYTGPIPESVKFDVQHLADLHRLVPLQHNHTYWRVDAPDTWVRAYNENPLYGRWNYPLGVTLYGLLHAAKAIGSTEAQQYVVNHVQLCCDTFRYALWDREQFGGATNVHHLLASIDSLDDCGSFGSCLLEVARHHELRGFREIADYVADYILHKQDRLADGSFYRKQMMHVFHENTMWADDLYMSVPFLCRYFELTGDGECIHDAARQFLGFKQRLFIPELKVMSHVFDLRRHLSTGIPWGRANGWTLFSLSELLAVLPADQPQRPEVLQMFRELAEGYLALQDENGMWHQVLTHPDSYPETSCTAMFIYGFARGVRYGWLEHPEPYANAALKAWGALNRTAIDRWGNVFGVCRGSEFSFTPEYYKKELLWNLNDTHGVGIVLLAGVEILRLAEHLRTNLKSKPR